MPDDIGTAVAVRTRSRAVTATAPKNETKKEKFRRLANIRALNAIEALERLGNLGSSAYEYDTAQITTLEKAISEATKKAFSQLQARTATRTTKREII